MPRPASPRRRTPSRPCNRLTGIIAMAEPTDRLLVEFSGIERRLARSKPWLGSPWMWSVENASASLDTTAPVRARSWASCGAQFGARRFDQDRWFRRHL